MKKLKKENYLDKIPVRSDKLKWTENDDIVTLSIENKGVFNKIAQILFKKPPVSYIHLDENGSFIWKLIDGEKNIYEIGEKVLEHFGEKAQPLYERLIKYFEILLSYGFISWEA